MDVNSNIKLITSGGVPTTSNLTRGEIAFGKISTDSDKVHLYVSDGTSITDFNSAFSGGGDMSKLDYDSNDDGKVNSADVADAVPFSGITGKPTTLSGYGITDAAPSSHVGSTGTSQHGLGNGTNAGFSTNDYTTTEKTKLAGISTGATATTITNNLTTSTAGTALDAAQGKVLQDSKAPLASPTFTGIPAAPTATAGTATTQIATTAFVKGEFPTKVTIPKI